MRKFPKNNTFFNYNNRMHKNPAPEEMECGKYTLTFNPSRQPVTPNFKLDLITWHNGMDCIFKSLKYSTVELYPELSSGSRWHYHGLITVLDIMKFFIYDLPILRSEGAYEIDTIKDISIWTTYCTKQEKLMKQITKDNLVPYLYDSKKIMKVKVNSLNDTKFNDLIRYDDSSEYEGSPTEGGSDA